MLGEDYPNVKFMAHKGTKARFVEDVVNGLQIRKPMLQYLISYKVQQQTVPLCLCAKPSLTFHFHFDPFLLMCS
jgi:hypothetical protein